MSEHPIEGLMNTAMNSIKDMVDVNTIIGEPIETSNNIIIIPISKVGFGFAAGGSEFKGETVNEYTKKEKEEEIQDRLPYGGGSGMFISPLPLMRAIEYSKEILKDEKEIKIIYLSPRGRLLNYQLYKSINRCIIC